jgi:biopolymer transport protein ExbD
MGGDAHRTHRREVRGSEDGAGGARLSLAVTPMIDVVFLLLLYFVLTSGLAVDERLLRSESAPQAMRDAGTVTAALELEEEPLVIALSRAGDATLWQVSGGLAQPSDEAALERVLRDVVLTAERPGGLFAADHPVRIAPAGDVPWEDVVAAFRAVTAAGFRSVAFGGGR